jgi:predicted DNA-binding transcriptional regulator AlpA
MARRFVRFAEMQERGYFANRMAAWRAVRSGFPAPYELGKNTIAWDLDEVEVYVATLPRRVPGSQPSLKRGPKPHRAIATEAV